MIQFEQEIISYLSLPSIPKKEWDGKTGFKSACAVVRTMTDCEAYAVATFVPDIDETPRITKVFGYESFTEILHIYPVPEYMNDKVETFDVDEESKKNAERLVDEANEITDAGVDEIKEPENEYFFDNITNDEEAAAFIASFNKSNKIKHAKVPKTHDGLVMRLAAIHSEMQKKA